MLSACQQRIDGEKLGGCSEFLFVGKEPNQGDWVFNADILQAKDQKESSCNIPYGEIIKAPSNNLYLELGRRSCEQSKVFFVPDLRVMLSFLNQAEEIEREGSVANIRYNADSSTVYYLIDLSDEKNRQSLLQFPLQKLEIQVKASSENVAVLEVAKGNGTYFQSLLPCLDNPQILRYLSTGFYRY